MVITVDLGAEPYRVGVEDPADCGRFHVEVRGGDGPDWRGLAQALVDARVGRVEDDHAFVDVRAVRTLVAGRVGPEWAQDFEEMLAYARTKGWLDEAGTSVQAHVEWL